MNIIQRYAHNAITADQPLDVTFNEQGWFSATEAAKSFGKKPAEWLRLPEAEKYIQALCDRFKVGKSHFVKTKRGGVSPSTWLHPKLAVRFAQWLDIDFAIWCDEQIEGLIHGTHAVYDRRRARDASAATYKAMCAIVQIKRQQEGKESKPHHFMNEARLINWVLTGEFKSVDRDSLPKEDLDLLTRLEEQNIVFVGLGMSYDLRKTALYGFAEMYRKQIVPKIEAANCTALTKERPA